MKTHFTIKRISSGYSGTYSVFLHWKEAFALTVEPPWKDNEVNISCIPPGEYLCKRIVSPRFGPTFQIVDVPGRTEIVFHTGNFGYFPLFSKRVKSSTKGCVVVGEEFGRLWGFPALLSSKKGFREFLKRTKHLDEFYLKIEDHTK